MPHTYADLLGLLDQAETITDGRPTAAATNFPANSAASGSPSSSLRPGGQPTDLVEADVPGQAGARKWAAWIARVAEEVRIVSPAAMGFEVAKDHGKDLRDWITE